MTEPYQMQFYERFLNSLSFFVEIIVQKIKFSRDILKKIAWKG